MQRYSTCGIPPAQRLSFWNDVAAQTYGPLVVDSNRNDVFDGEIARLPLVGCELTSAQSTPATVRYQRASESRGELARSLNLQLQVSGRSEARHEGSAVQLRAGDLVLFDPCRPYAVTFTAPTHVFVLCLPRAQLIERNLDLDPLVGRRLPGDRGAGAMLSAFLASLWPRFDTSFDDAWARPASDILYTLIELAYQPRASVAETRSAPQKTLDRAKQYIDRELCDSEFDPLSVASLLGVTPRYVQLLFAREGTTPTRYLLKRRLELAAARLTHGAPESRISAIAFAVGFNELSHFNRSFRRQYGMTPGSFRTQRLA